MLCNACLKKEYVLKWKINACNFVVYVLYEYGYDIEIFTVLHNFFNVEYYTKKVEKRVVILIIIIHVSDNFMQKSKIKNYFIQTIMYKFLLKPKKNYFQLLHWVNTLFNDKKIHCGQYICTHIDRYTHSVIN